MATDAYWPNGQQEKQEDTNTPGTFSTHWGTEIKESATPLVKKGNSVIPSFNLSEILISASQNDLKLEGESDATRALATKREAIDKLWREGNASEALETPERKPETFTTEPRLQSNLGSSGNGNLPPTIALSYPPRMPEEPNLKHVDMIVDRVLERLIIILLLLVVAAGSWWVAYLRLHDIPLEQYREAYEYIMGD